MNALCALYIRLSQLPARKHAAKPISVISEDGCGAKTGTLGFGALQAKGRGVTAHSEGQDKQQAATSMLIRVWENLPSDESYLPLSKSLRKLLIDSNDIT